MKFWRIVQLEMCIVLILSLLGGCNTPTAMTTETPQTTFTPEPTATLTPNPPTSSPTATPTPRATASPTPGLKPTPMPTTAEGAGPVKTAVRAPFVAYTQSTETGPEIFVVNTSEDPPQVFALTETAGIAMRPRWSPDLQHIAYLYRGPEAEAFDLWLIDSTGSVPDRAVTTGGLEGLENYTWSADSRFLVFSGAGAGGAERDLFRVDVESGEMVNLTADSPVWDSDPACSPDGKWIAFVSDRAEDGKGTDHIWVMAPDGSDLRQLTNTDWEDVNPAWSPDSAKIAFYRWSFIDAGEGGPSGLWVTKADGSDARLVIELSVMGAGLDAPVWSPDGNWIAYQSGAPDEADVYVISTEGGGPVRVSDLPGNECSISWAPDSGVLIFTNETDEGVRLYMAAPDGTETRPLLDEEGNGLAEWQPAFPADW